MTHRTEIRVHYEDTDMAGVVYYANYLKFIERARSDALREAGIDQRAMRDEGVVFIVKGISAEYVRPARYDDVMTVETALLEMRGASAVLRQDVFVEGRPAFTSSVRIASMTVEGRPVRWTAEAKAALEAL